MKILFLSQVLPYPLDAGPKVRSFYNISYLAQKHSIILLTFVRDSDSIESINYLKTICDQVETVRMPRSRMRDAVSAFKSLVNGEPFLITRDSILEMEEKLAELVKRENFDAIHADQLWMAPYAIKGLKAAAKIGQTPMIVLDQHNAVFMIPQRMADSTRNPLIKMWLLREAKLMSAYERTICAKFDHVIWVTREDQKAVLGTIAVQSIGKFHPTTLDSEKKQSIIPICYDPIDIVSVDTVPKTKNILFIGGMHWPPNAEGICWFADEIFPEIRRAMPDAQLIAVGKQPPKTLQHASGEIITPGFVEKTEPYWEMSRVFVVPLQAGGGMRVKILDAWARGIPVVSTTIGAEGISYTPEKDILIADNPREFAFKVQKVLQDDELAQQLSINGRKLLQHSYDWRKIYSEWDNVYDTES